MMMITMTCYLSPYTVELNHKNRDTLEWLGGGLFFSQIDQVCISCGKWVIKAY